MAWDEVWRGESEAEAEIVAGGLASSGYAARVLAAGVFTAIPTGLNSWAVVVPTQHAAAARAMLRRSGDTRVSGERPGIDWRAHAVGVALLGLLLAVGAVALAAAALLRS